MHPSAGIQIVMSKRKSIDKTEARARRNRLPDNAAAASYR